MEAQPTTRGDGQPHGVPLAIGVFAFSYGGIGVFPTVYTSMSNKRHFLVVLMISFGIAICCYAILGIIGVLMFGDAVKSQVTLNMPRHLLASKIAIWATVALLNSPCFCHLLQWRWRGGDWITSI
ncbi:hypothetical protein L7F22_004929 [Adiantum nelumboides]|nr:hypothetical protein [Adiantum nelumboides]